VLTKTYSTVSIAVGFLFFFAAALDIRDHYALWATFSILFGIFLIILGGSFGLAAERQKSARRLSFGFLGAALVFLIIALVFQS
jgi:hypothetical protein